MTPLFYIALLISAVHSYSPAPRWGQATSLVYSALFIQGGKQDPDGSQTYFSAPPEDDLLLLPLSASFSVDSPPWELISTSTNSSTSPGPPVAWHTLSAFNSSDLLLFGGQPSQEMPIVTGNDSAWLLDVYDRSIPEFTDQDANWDSEPMRRIHHAAVSTTTGEVYIFGGETADQSDQLFAEHYVFDPSTDSFALLPTDNNAPPALTGHCAAILPNGQILIFGGMSASGLLSFDLIYVFDTSTNAWLSPQTVSSTSFPSGRRAFACTLLDDNNIIIQGGCDGALQTCANVADGWIYTVNSTTWTEVPNLQAVGARRDHFAASYGGQVIFGFGYDDNEPANATLVIYDSAASTCQSTFTPPPATSSVTPTIPVASATATNTGGSSGSGTLTGSVHPTATGGGSGGGGGGSGGGGSGGGGSDVKPEGATTKTTTIAIATVIGVLALVALGAGAVWYMRKQHQKHWAEGGVGGVFSPLQDEEGGVGGAPAARMFDSAPGEKGLVGGGVESIGTSVKSWGLWVAAALGLGVVGSGVAAAERDRKQRRDMLADEDTRDFGGWYEDEDGHSSRFGPLRQGSGGSTWSLMSVFRPKPRREASAASGFSFGSRINSRGASLLGHGEGPSEKDPFRDEMFLRDAAAGGAGVLATSTRPTGHRQASYASTNSMASNYVDPFADPISDQDIAGPGALLTNIHSRTGPLSPVTEVSRISSSGASQSGSSNDHQVLSPFDSISRSSVGFSSNSHQTSPALPLGASPAVSPGPSTISSRPQPRTTSILDMKPTQPDQPMRRSDTWWARFSSKSLLDRRTSRGSATGVRAPDIRDPNPLPQRLGFVQEETPSVLRERSDGSDSSRVGATGLVYGAGTGHGKSMSSLQTQRTADSAAIERMGGNVDVVLRGNRQSGSTSTRASVTTQGGSVDEGPARLSWHPTDDPNDQVFTSPVEMVPASAFDLPTSPPRKASPPPAASAPRPPLSTSSSGSSGSGAVAERIRAYERRMSQDVTPPSPTNTKAREERPRKKTHSVYGLVARPSLFVANPDHRAGQSSGDS
ncbi:hypothetical protein DFH07DRAFT_416564 [Mycena maculata]|uniref:Galactose oxidase n=1 Tax=Mycena maculata TaxID=230809 RepID=A0AAD7JGF2_9AGAR|nr:hypothetical protein DFH07DRAFT_416564 [Mycena maculata]